MDRIRQTRVELWGVVSKSQGLNLQEETSHTYSTKNFAETENFLLKVPQIKVKVS